MKNMQLDTSKIKILFYNKVISSIKNKFKDQNFI